MAQRLTKGALPLTQALATAIKVLPEPVASDPDLKQRFEREARTISVLCSTV